MLVAVTAAVTAAVTFSLDTEVNSNSLLKSFADNTNTDRIASDGQRRQSRSRGKGDLLKRCVLILVTFKAIDLQTTDVHTKLRKTPMESCNAEGLKITV